MKKVIIHLVAALLVAAPIFGASQERVQTTTQDEVSIRVLLSKGVPGALLEVRGPYAVLRGDDQKCLSSGDCKRFAVHALSQGLRWGEEYPDVYAITVIPRSQETKMFVDGMQYRGSISIYSTDDEKIVVVNHVPLEDYLKATLAMEIEQPLSHEAIAALTIGARTVAYKALLENKTSDMPWDTTAKESKYFGYGVTHQKNGVEEAVDKTRHLVLLEKTKMPAQIHFTKEVAQEMAMSGLDAKTILRNLCPGTSLGATVEAREIKLR